MVFIQNFLNCPICSHALENFKGYDKLVAQKIAQGRWQGICQYTCNLSTTNHYYSHGTILTQPDNIIFQELSVEVPNKRILLSNNYFGETSLIKFYDHSSPISIPTILVPDFPDLEKLKNKIRLAITFG